jgi:hypothetical protein
MAAESCSAEVKGSGNCNVFSVDKLDVDISGSGNIYYKGKSVIVSHIPGSGKLVKRL